MNLMKMSIFLKYSVFFEIDLRWTRLFISNYFSPNASVDILAEILIRAI